MIEYRIDSVLIKARLCGLTPTEEVEHIKAYWWFADYYNKHNPRNSDLCAVIGYAEKKFSEAYKMSEIRLQRTIDEWHEVKKQ